MRIFLLTVLAAVMAIAGPAAADDQFHPVPASGKARPKLKLRVVSYDGATNGELTVEITNRGRTAATFDARGLYFVPDVEAAQAPQRLGAVGPMQLVGDGGAADDRHDTVTIAAGATRTVILDVFCIDSHRASPTSSTPFTVGKQRMPAALARKVEADGRSAAKRAGGVMSPTVRSEVQGAVWKARDQNWVKLEGEGAQEAGK